MLQATKDKICTANSPQSVQIPQTKFSKMIKKNTSKTDDECLSKEWLFTFTYVNELHEWKWAIDILRVSIDEEQKCQNGPAAIYRRHKLKFTLSALLQLYSKLFMTRCDVMWLGRTSNFNGQEKQAFCACLLSGRAALTQCKWDISHCASKPDRRDWEIVANAADR